jgi:Holliday junction resolvase-like predicted endonuclease
MNPTKKKRIGNLGEELTSIFLIKKGHKIIDRN